MKQESKGNVQTANSYVLRLLLFFLALVAVGWLPLVQALHLAPTRSPLFEKARRMGDLFNASAQVQHFSALTIGPTFNYPAPAAFVLLFFLRSGHPKIYFVAAVVLSVLLAATLLWLALRRSSLAGWLSLATVVCFAALGNPQLFVLDRANLEWVGWILLVLGIACFYTHRYLAMAVLLGVAACMKPFPIVFLLLLLYRKRYKEIAIGVAVAVVLMLTALKALGPTVQQASAALKVGMQTYKTNYIESIRMPDEMRFDHALMSPVRMALFSKYGHARMDPLTMTSTALPVFARLDLWHTFFSVVGLAGLLWTAWTARRLPALNQILLLSVATVLFPYLSSEYTLLTLYIPFGLVLIWLGKDVANGSAAPPRFFLLALFALLLAPLGLEFSIYAGVVKCVLLLTLFVYTLQHPMRMRSLDELAYPARAGALQ